MDKNLVIYNVRFLHLSVIIIVLSSLHSIPHVFGQRENENSQINNEFSTWLDWLSAPVILTVGTIVASIWIGPVIAKRWQDHRNEIELKTRLAADISECVMKTLVAIMQVEEFYSSYKQEDTLGTRVDVSADQEKVKLLKKLEEARNHAYYEGFKVKSHVIQSEIQAHFIEFSKAWNVLIDLVQFVEKLSEQSEAKKRKEQIIDRHVDPPHDKYLKAYEPYEDEKKDKKEDRKLSLDEPVYKALLVDAGKKYNQSHDKHSSIDDFKKMLAAMDVEAWYEVKHVIVERKNNIITNILDPETESPAFHRRILHI